jgi:hypothetical protein
MLVGCAIENGAAHFRFTPNSLTLASSLSQSLHANHSGVEVPMGRMDWSCTDFWLAVPGVVHRCCTVPLGTRRWSRSVSEWRALRLV